MENFCVSFKEVHPDSAKASTVTCPNCSHPVPVTLAGGDDEIYDAPRTEDTTAKRKTKKNISLDPSLDGFAVKVRGILIGADR